MMMVLTKQRESTEDLAEKHGIRIKIWSFTGAQHKENPGLRLRENTDIQNKQYVILRSSTYFYQSKEEASVFCPSQAERK